ncbi:DNA translocase FtsK 4TM domain-containing protein [Bariatricus sp. HCP28S3_A7]|uniref:FtsK/SpoIIIE family DNA translocase n=1 Tax=Bariatricus sp. HCP28S3_A7 TaxID=3438894 RepID=UPI003F88B6E6
MASKTEGKEKTSRTSTSSKSKGRSQTKKKTGNTGGVKKTKTAAAASQNSFIAGEILIWVTLAVSILLVISNFGLAGFVGAKIAGVMQKYIGWMAYVFPILLFCGVAFVVSNRGNSVAYIKISAAAVLTILLCVLLQLLNDRGGLIGEGIADLMVPAIGVAGTYVVVVILMIICIVLITERSVLRGVRKGSEKAYDRAREDMKRHREESIEKKMQKEQVREQEREQKRMDHQVSGVSFNTTLDRKLEEPKTESETDKKEQKKRTSRVKATKRSKQDVNTVIAGAEEAAAKHIMEQTGQIALDDVVINRAMPLSAVELKPEPEPEPSVNPAEHVPDFLKDAMEEAKAASGKTQPETVSERITAQDHTADVPQNKRNSSKMKADVSKETADVEQIISQTQMPKEYSFPPISLLKKGSGSGGDSDKHLRETAMKLQKTLQTFGVNVTITNISCGPSVTRYELQPEMGVKVSKIVGLADDIKLNLAAADIRIEAPIPGKAAVGIEVPNKENSTVMLRDLLESDEFKKNKSKIAFATGRDIAGKVVVSDIAKMPHLLVAGATGSGKSVCINTLIMSILYKAKPDEVKLIMVDPKVVELSVYNGIPHLLIPVVTDPKKAAGALNWAVAEMNKRYQLFAEYNVRDIKGFNDRVENIKDIDDPDKPQKMPQIVIIVDELADLMMVAPGDVEESICRLAQLARAAGIHLVLATQRPSVNVITGLIKANMPSRIAFSVSSGVDSRTIIDMNGAEKLLGKGDMLFYPAGYQKPVRVQGAFVSDKEVQNVVEYLKENSGKITYNEDIQNHVNLNPSAAQASGGADDRDVYFVEAGKFIIEKDKASIGMLQRVFKIGFNRAARIMDQLAEAGVVGEEEGTKPRKVLMSMEEFEQYIEEYV